MGIVEQAKRQNLLLDFSGVRFMSSAFLGLLVKIHRRACEKNGHLTLKNIDSSIYKVFEITQLTKVFDISWGKRYNSKSRLYLDSPLWPSRQSWDVYVHNAYFDGARTAIEMIGLSEKWLENINIENALFENVQDGAIAHRVKELSLDGVSITSSGRPISLEDVFEATIENVDLSGQRPLLFVGGSESG